MIFPESNPNELAGDSNEQGKPLAEETNEQSEGTQGAEEQSQDENSLEGFDASKLSPELQKVYKSMQADYVRKTQTIAKEKKSFEQKAAETDTVRKEYEQKLADATKPKSEEDDVFGLNQMDEATRTQTEASLKKLDKWVDKKIADREKGYKNEISLLRGQLGNFAWNSFAKTHKDADRVKMRELAQGIGGNPSLEQLYLLSKGEKELKQAGAEEYKNRVQTKKNVVTTKPTSTAGEEADINFENTKMSWNPQKTARNVLKAFKGGEK